MATRRALLLPHLRGRVRHRRDGRRRPGRARPRRRRPSGVARATCAPRAAGSRPGITRPAASTGPRLHGRDVDLGRAADRPRRPARTGSSTRAVPTRSRSTSRPVSPTTPPARSRRASGSRRSAAARSSPRSPSTTRPCSSPRELVSGEPMLNPVWDPTAPGLAIFVGTNPVVSHGYGTALPDPIRYLREYRAAGGKVWVLDPRRTETAALRRRVRARPARRRRRGARGAGERAARARRRRGRAARALRRRPRSRRCAPRSPASRSNAPPRRADVDPALLEQLVADVRAHRVASRCTAAPA